MKNLICIVCPKGCHLSVDESNDFAVTGNSCKRGETYGKTEIKDPHRVVTSTVAVSGSSYVRCPVKTDKTIPKGLMFEAMRTLDRITIPAPVKLGQIIVKRVCNTDANFVATREIKSPALPHE
jgi:CxxC motif-containing protein